MQDKNTKKEKLTSNKDEQTNTFDKVIEALLDVPVKRAGSRDKKKKSKKQVTQKK